MSRPAHKRTAGSQGEGPSQHAPKKTRFVEPSEDPVNFAEEVDSQLENPSARRKGRVNTAGYESDSSDDGEGVVLSRRPHGTGVDDDDDDMFALGEKEEKETVEDMGGKKKQEFMRLGDIEGQEFGKEGSEDEDNEDDEPEDDDDAERRKKAGMGYELSSFNMREEMEEGKFASDGTYVRTFDPHAVHDKWMDGMDDKEIKRARRQRRHQERLQKEMMLAEEKELAELGGKENIEMKLLGMLKKGETVVEALYRLGAKAKKHASGKKRLNNRFTDAGDSMAVDQDKDQDLATKPKTDIDGITHLASMLMSFGDTDIYNKTYEEFVRSVRSSGKVDQSWLPPSANVRYEYVWDVPDTPHGQVFGPYSEEEMQTWFKASYFGAGGEKIKIRTVGSSNWGSWDAVVT